MATQKYTIFKTTESGEVEAATRTAKATALKVAGEIRAEEKVAVRVTTPSGKTIFEAKAPKSRIITVRTPKWTRVEANVPEAGEGVTLPEGYDVAYVRTRGKLAVLRKQGERGNYLVQDLATGDTFPAENTKETAQIMKRIRQERLANA